MGVNFRNIVSCHSLPPTHMKIRAMQLKDIEEANIKCKLRHFSLKVFHWQCILVTCMYVCSQKYVFSPFICSSAFNAANYAKLVWKKNMSTEEVVHRQKAFRKCIGMPESKNFRKENKRIFSTPSEFMCN